MSAAFPTCYFSPRTYLEVCQRAHENGKQMFQLMLLPNWRARMEWQSLLCAIIGEVGEKALGSPSPPSLDEPLNGFVLIFR